MMDIFCHGIAFIMIITGVIGCFLPIIPGPLLAYLGILCLLPTTTAPSSTILIAFGVLTITITVLDYFIPVIGAKRFRCTRYGVRGCAVGTILGLFALPVGLILGPFLGAFVGEIIARQSINDAILSAVGALVGFIAGVITKTIVCVVMLTYVLVRVWTLIG